jgi:hypothetical protein
MKKQQTKIVGPEATVGPSQPAAQSKRYDEGFKRQAVEHWIKSGKPGTQIAAVTERFKTSH